MHRAVKALVVWCVAGYSARLVSWLAHHALYGGIGRMFAVPDIIFTLILGVMWLPFSVALCLAIYLVGQLIRKPIGRFSSRNPDLVTGLSFAIAVVLTTLLLVVLLGKEWSFDGVSGPVEVFADLVPYGLAAFAVYRAVGRDPTRPYALKVY